MNIKRAFTLIELLVVITIILILLGLITPMLGTVKEKVNRTKCQSHLKQIHLASVQRFGQNTTRFPNIPADADRAAELLPYMKYMVEVFACPSSPGLNMATFNVQDNQGNVSVSLSNTLDYAFNANIWAGLSQSVVADATITVLACDVDDKSSTGLQYTHNEGLSEVFMDGHAVFVLTNKTPAKSTSTMWALGLEK